jgi:uncharacterized membrane protein
MESLLASVDGLVPALTLAAALGCGLIGGVFFAFSTFVMRALARLPRGEGISAMQSINVTVINPLFLGVFLLSALACAALMGVAVLRWPSPGAVYLLAGGGLYFVGTFLVTLIFNVPMNKALAPLGRADPRGETYWPHYVAGWTAWNHVRTIAALAAAALLSFAVMRG